MEWSQSVKLFVQVKGKFGYLSRATVKPNRTRGATGSEKWEAENSMIMSWLVNSMEANLGMTYLVLPSAHAIWSAVNETYSDLGNAGQLFDIKTRLRKAKQGEKSVTSTTPTSKCCGRSSISTATMNGAALLTAPSTRNPLRRSACLISWRG